MQVSDPPLHWWVGPVAPVEVTWRPQLTVFNRTVIKKEEKLERKEEKRLEDIKKEKDQDELTPGTASRSRVAKSGEPCLEHQWKGWRHGRRWRDHGQEASKICHSLGFALCHV